MSDGRTHYEGCWESRGHHDCAVAEIKRLRSLIGDALTAESQAMGLYENRVKCDACGALTPDAWIVHEEGDRNECMRCWHKENERELRNEIKNLRAEIERLRGEWKPASEPPDTDREVLVFIAREGWQDADWSEREIGKYSGSKWCFSRVTHWRELPEGPGATNREPV